MKKLAYPILAALLLAPFVTKAQWSAVRFDSTNTYYTVHAATPLHAFVVGEEPWNGVNFLMRTSDGGVSWDSIPFANNGEQFFLSELHFPDTANGFAGGIKFNGLQVLLKTTDNGNTWQDATPDSPFVGTLAALRFANPSLGLAGAGTKIYRTEDGGVNWNTAETDFFPLDFSFANASTVFAAGQTELNQAAIKKSTDGGLTWATVLDTFNQDLFVNQFHIVQAVSEDLVFCSIEYSNKMFVTLDGGASWHGFACDSVLSVLDFHFNNADTGYVLSGWGQLYCTTDGGESWTLQYTSEWGFYGPAVQLNSLSFVNGVGYMTGSNGLIKRYGSLTNAVPRLSVSPGSLRVFPNPTSNSSALNIETELTGECVVSVYNNLGQRVLAETVTKANKLEPIVMQNMNLAVGTYNAVVSNGRQEQNAAFIVTR